jgi:hypothetical protein
MSTGQLFLPGISMRLLPPPLCDRAAFRQLATVDVASNCIVALPLGIFMWLLQLQSLILDRNKITAFPFCLFLRTHVVIHDAPPAPPTPNSAANLTAYPFARPLKISCQHNPLKDPFTRIARGDAAGAFTDSPSHSNAIIITTTIVITRVASVAALAAAGVRSAVGDGALGHIKPGIAGAAGAAMTPLFKTANLL